MLTIYGPAGSTTRRCLWALEEVGAMYEHKNVDMPNQEHKSDWFLALNPNGKVPVLTDGDFAMWESLAINMYLAKTYKPELLGATPHDEAHVLQWNFWAVAHLSQSVELLGMQAWRQTPDDAFTEKARVTVTERLPALERSLEGKDWLVGNAFTIADLNVVVHLAGAERYKIDLTAFPNITRWLAAATSRPAYAAAMSK